MNPIGQAKPEDKLAQRHEMVSDFVALLSYCYVLVTPGEAGQQP